MSDYVYPRLTAARRVARRLNLPIPYSSQHKGKKLFVIWCGHQIHFGARDYSDFLDHKDEDRRRRYRIRARGATLGDGSPAYMNRNSPAYYAYRILW